MRRLLNAALLLSSLLGYLQWGKDQHAFLFQVEFDILFNKHNAENFTHPFVLIPLLGQLLLLFTVFQKHPSRILTYIAMAGLGLLLVFIFLIGLLSRNAMQALSVVPFIITAILVIKYNRRKKESDK